MPEIVLASGSRSRQAMLREAGVAFAAHPAPVDEDSFKDAFLAGGQGFAELADALAEMKAVRVSLRFPDAVVLGADQVLVCDGVLFSKAETLADARSVLRRLRGKTHRLISAAVLAKAGAPLWRHSESADLHMREFSDAFLEDYLADEGERLLGSVGCYRIEGPGAQLFARVQGDTFTVRGLPLIAVLEHLRALGALAR
jgi:septum formation protein